MKSKTILIYILSLFINGLWAQSHKYSRVLIKGEPKELIKKLSQIGLLPDHDHFSNNGVTTEINEDDINLLKQNNICYKVLIDDMTAYYVERNRNALKATASITDCNMPDLKTPTHFHLGSMGGFFTLTEMTNILDSMALLYPNLISVKQAASSIQSIEGRNIWYLKISDNPNVDENEPELLYTALHHAREPQSLSQLIFYMWYLLENYATNPEIKGIVDNTEMFFIPCINPDGYVYNYTNSPAGGGMWRKNRRVNAGNTFGIDLNRNYGYNWGYDNFGSSPSSNSDTYRGTAAFSEPETQAVRNFCNGRQFKAALNAHSFGNHLIYPWGYIPSLLTLDSSIYNNWGEYLTEKSAYSYGTCDQTLFYITNGSSDDWMYGEQTTKPKIFAFTPETGSATDGFWPASNRIIDLCKFTFYQNLNLAKVSGSCFVAEDKTDHFLSSGGYIKFGLSNLGLSGNTATVSIQAISSNVSSVGQAKIFSTITQLQTITDSIAYQLSSNVLSGQKIRYVLKVNTGAYIHSDTITKVFGQPVTAFSNAGNNLSANFTSTGSWVLSTTDYVSPPSSIADSQGLYASGSNEALTMNQVADLSSASYAHLQFYTKFDIEKFFDAAQILISTDNGSTFDHLCTPHQTAPRSYDGTDPVFDFRKDKWVKEEVDLSNYLGMGIVLRFTFISDNGNEKDGIYFDDILVRKLHTVNNNPLGINPNTAESNLIFPNPSSGKFEIKGDLLYQTIKIYNAQGQMIYYQDAADNSKEIDLTAFPTGIYLVKSSKGFSQKLIIE